MLTRAAPLSRSLAVVAVIAFAGGAASAQSTKTATVYTTITPATVADILKGEGYDPEIAKDPDAKDGRDLVNFELDGTKVTVYFYDCTNNVCQSAELAAGFDVGDPPDLAKVNDFNLNYLFTRLYAVQESGGANVLWLESDLNLRGGITVDNIKSWLGIYTSNLNDLLDEFKLR